jgi:alpha-ribazole phosphatase
MKILFIRHGKTKGNVEKRYIGTTDEPLCDKGVKEITAKKYPSAEKIVSSPMKRCIQTAQIIYNYKDIEIAQDLRECDFGDFENKNFDELKNNSLYIKWLKSQGTMPFPNGETHRNFCERCCICFEKVIRESKFKSIAFVVHGGTVMAILERFAGGSFYDWQIKNGDWLMFDVFYSGGKIFLKKINDN